MGEFGKAIDDLSKTLALDAGNADAHFNRGVAYSMQGKLSNAIEDWSRVSACVRASCVRVLPACCGC